MTRTSSCRAVALPLLLSLVLLSACARDRATLEAGARFGAAAITLAATTEDEVLHIRRAVIDLRSERRALEDPAATTGSAQPPPSPLPIDTGVDAADAEARIAAARTLAAFGSLLVGADGDAGAHDPTRRIIDSLRLRGALELSDEQADALTDLADAVSRHTFTSQRAGAVRTALLETEAPVRDLATAIRLDFDPQAQRWLAALSNEQVEAQYLLERMEASADPRVARARTLAHQADRAASTALQTAERIRAAADAFTDAHAALVEGLRADDALTLDDLDALLEEAERLKVAWVVLRGD